jgi:DNA modification methylase
MGDPWTRKEVIGDCTLYLGDCLEVMPALGKVDAVVTDPPYGIGADKGKRGAPSFKGGKAVERAWFPDNNWDDIRPDDAVFAHILALKCPAIIWGGNYFADLLPPMGRWLWWDKCQVMPSFGDGELAWTNLKQKTPKKFTLSNNKIMAQRLERFHPTQKPLALMQWCLGFLPEAEAILDPFIGGGTTLVACARLGRKGIGIELDPGYFETACKRVQAAYDQPDLFVAPPTPPTQEGMDL